MRDINKELRKAYFTALSGITNGGAPVPVYYMKLPTSVDALNYIVYRGLTSNDVSTKNSFDSDTGVVVEIHTYTDGTNNNGNASDEIADQVLQRIYPSPQSTLAVAGTVVSNTTVQDDTTQDFTDSANRSYISRFITFIHRIYQN